MARSLTRHPALRVARIAREVTRRRRSLGPLQPGWEWSYEVAQAFMKEQFRGRGEIRPEVVRRRMDGAGDFAPNRGCQIVHGRPGGVPSAMVVPPGYDDRIFVYLHGGAYVFGSHRSHKPLLTALARQARSRVLAVNYRLAPEHPCPAAIDDVVAVWRALLGAGITADRLVLVGDSAGGGLALAAMMALREVDLPQPSGAVLLSPWTDLAITGESAQGPNEVDYLGHGDALYRYGGLYAGELSREDPRVSPLYASDLAELPPTLILAGGAEVLLDDATRMAERLRDAGRQVQLHVEPHEVHVYPMFVDLSRRAREGVGQIAGWERG